MEDHQNGTYWYFFLEIEKFKQNTYNFTMTLHKNSIKTEQNL